MFRNEDRKMIERLEAGLELHEKALVDLRAAHAAALEALQNYRAKRVFEAKAAQDADHTRRRTISTAAGGDVLPMASMVFLPAADYKEVELENRKRFLHGEVNRITEKIRLARQVLGDLQREDRSEQVARFERKQQANHP